jgi:hypothetical protein
VNPFDPAPYPEFAHQVAACLARMAREDREAVAGSLRRLGFRIQNGPDADARRASRPGRAPGNARKRSRGCDFRYASPISSTPRQRSDMRIPHLDYSNINRTSVPRSASGETHPRYPERTAVAAEHYDYLTEGAETTYRTHFDYITRLIGPMTVGRGEPAMDILDFEADHRDRNALAVLSNIPGGAARQRGLFEAAERCEREAHRGTLAVSTEHADVWAELAAASSAPQWVREAALLLQRALLADRAKAAKAGRKHQHRAVEIADVDLTQAYERLVWADTALGNDAAALPQFEQGRAGRVQTRFVVELPNGLDARQHRMIMERFCARLDGESWMYVAAIHCPDTKNDPRNVHLHVDAYDRPSKWMLGMGTDGKLGPGCWDFEVAKRKRNGSLQYPHRQQKIGVLRGEKGQNRREVGEAYFKELRAAYVTLANEVAAGTAGATRYVTGTYRDNGIRQDPLEHLGDKIIGNEKRGLVTDAGSRNARIIFNDRLRHVRHIAVSELLALRREARALLAMAETDAVRLSVWQWRQVQGLAIRKQAQATAAGIVHDMAISRAVTVTEHSQDAKRVAAAKAWIAETDQAAGIVEGAPKLSDAEWGTETVAVTADLLHGKVRGVIPASAPPLIYRRRGHQDLQPVGVKHRDSVRDRLLKWLDEHKDASDALVFDDVGVALGVAERRKAIDRLFRLFIDDLIVQERLRAIRDRRLKQKADDLLASRTENAGVATVSEEPAIIDRAVDDGRYTDHTISVPDVADIGGKPVRDSEAGYAAIMPPLSGAEDPVEGSERQQRAEGAPKPQNLTDASGENSTGPRVPEVSEHRVDRDFTDPDHATPSKVARREALAKLNALRDDGWAMLVSGKASITRSNDGYAIIGMPDANRKALLQPGYREEFKKRLATLSEEQPAGAAANPKLRLATTPRASRLFWPFGGSTISDWPDGPAVALRESPALHAAPSLGGLPRLRGARKSAKRVAFASDLAVPPQNGRKEAPAITTGFQNAGGKTGIRKQAEAEALDGKMMIAKPKGPDSTAAPGGRNKPGHER